MPEFQGWTSDGSRMGCLLHRDDVVGRTLNGSEEGWMTSGGAIALDHSSASPTQPHHAAGCSGLLACRDHRHGTPSLFRAHSGALTFPKRASPVVRPPAPTGPCRSWLRCLHRQPSNGADDVIVTTTGGHHHTNFRFGNFGNMARSIGTRTRLRAIASFSGIVSQPFQF
jgi:hypothetical protein